MCIVCFLCVFLCVACLLAEFCERVVCCVSLLCLLCVCVVCYMYHHSYQYVVESHKENVVYFRTWQSWKGGEWTTKVCLRNPRTLKDYQRNTWVIYIFHTLVVVTQKNTLMLWQNLLLCDYTTDVLPRSHQHESKSKTIPASVLWTCCVSRVFCMFICVVYIISNWFCLWHV